MLIYANIKKTRFINIIFFLFLSIFTFSEIKKTWAGESLEELEIAVIGGGLSGLTAARKLKENGRPYDLFEAKEKLGGRTYSVTQGDNTFNMGGEWIDAEHEAMLALANDLGITLQKESYTAPIRSTYNGRELSPDDMISILRSIISKLSTVVSVDTEKHKSLQDLMSELSLEQNEELFIKAYVTSDLGLSPEAVQANIAIQLKKDLEDYLNILWCQSSCCGLLRPLCSLAYQYRVVGGMNTMIEAIQNQLDEKRLHLNHKLTKISKDETDKFHLFFETSNSGLYEVIVNTVVMSIPFSVLRHIELDDSLGLSSLHTEAIRTLSYGTNAKIQIPDAMPLLFRYQLNTERTEGDTVIPSSTVWNSVSGSGTTIYLGGEAGKNLDQDNAIGRAHSVFGGTKSGNGSFLIKNWHEDEHAQGSYSTRGLYSRSLDEPSEILPGFRAFANPVGQFYFVGEHTQEVEGYMESAVQSANTAVKHLLEHL